MADSKLVPFGKYKGQPVEVLAQDEPYCRWLADQEWFRTRFVAIHTLIVNNFTEAADSPEHNALQARFLDATWCQQFFLAGMTAPDLERQATYQLQLARKYRQKCLRESQKATLAWKSYADQGWRQTEARDALIRLDVAEQELADFEEQFKTTTWSFYIEDREFEVEGIDVVLAVAVRTDESFPHYWEGDAVERASSTQKLVMHRRFSVECKPLVGDDYPAVLRQMRATKGVNRILLADEVRSAVVSIDQIRQIFGTAGIQVLTVADVDRQAIRWGVAG